MYHVLPCNLTIITMTDHSYPGAMATSSRASETADVVVVGAGAAGLSAARCLHERGFRVIGARLVVGLERNALPSFLTAFHV